MRLIHLFDDDQILEFRSWEFGNINNIVTLKDLDLVILIWGHGQQ